jgi:SAM-dependent methyltransferase
VTVNLWSQREHALDYLENIAARMPRREDGYRALGEVLPPAPDRILDLGCGDGEVIGRVLGAFPDAQVVGVDFSPEMLDRVRKRFGGDGRVAIVEHDLDRALDPAWGEFDAVVSAFAIHHVVDDRKRSLYAEAFALVRPGGLFANLEHVASPTEELHREFLCSVGMDPDDDDPSNKLASVEDQLGWLRAAGFAQVDCFWKWRELALLAGRRSA